MITLTDIAYVRSGVADLEAATRFATDIVGLELVTPTEVGVAHLRADHRHHCLALVEGPSGVISSGFAVADSNALDAAGRRSKLRGVKAARMRASSRSGRSTVSSRVYVQKPSFLCQDRAGPSGVSRRFTS